jgi:hypothetical protein
MAFSRDVEAKLKTICLNKYGIVSSLFSLYSSAGPGMAESARRLNILQLLHLCSTHKLLSNKLSPVSLEDCYFAIVFRGQPGEKPSAESFKTRNSQLFENRSLLSRPAFLECLVRLARHIANSGGSLEQILHDMLDRSAACSQADPSFSETLCSHEVQNSLKMVNGQTSFAFSKHGGDGKQSVSWSNFQEFASKLSPSVDLADTKSRAGLAISTSVVNGEIALSYAGFLEMTVRVALQTSTGAAADRVSKLLGNLPGP